MPDNGGSVASLKIDGLEAQNEILLDLLAAFRGRRPVTADDIAEADAILDAEGRASDD